MRIDAPLDVVRDRVPGHFGTLRADAHSVLFETHYDDLEAVALFLNSLRLPFAVVEPEALKTKLCDIATRVLANT